MKIANTFIRNGFILTISSLFLRCISMIFNIFLSNKISTTTLGAFGLIMSVFSFLLTISLSGINLSSTRLISEENSYGAKNNIPAIMRDCFKYCILFSAISILIMFIFKSYIVNNILGNTVSSYLIYILAFALPACSLSSCLNGYFLAMKKITVVVISQILEVLMQIIIVTIFYAFNNFNTTNEVCLALIIGLIFADICSFLYLAHSYIIDRKNYGILTKHRKSFKKDICKISIPVAFTTYIKSGLSTIKNSLIPIAFVGYGLTYDNALSYYGIISSTVMTLLLFPFTFIQSYSNLLIPELSSYNMETNLEKIKRITKKSLKTTFLFSILVIIFFIIFAHFIDEYLYKSLSIEFYIKLLAPIILYIYIDSVIDSILKSLNLQVFVMVINIIDLIVSILFIKFLIPIFGVYGYIFILYFSEIFNFSLSLFALYVKFKRASR